MFADLAGFVALAEKLDPELLRDLLNDVYGRLAPCIERCGGTVDKFIGDCLVALFGAPLSHADHAQRALRAALEMREELRGFGRERGLELSLHVGINTGRVVTGRVGTADRGEYSVIGDAVNVAARLEELASADEILVGADTHRLATPAFELEEVGPLSVRGRVEPIRAYRLVQERSHGSAVTERRAISSCMVGRQEELERFRTVMAELGAGLGGVVIVAGEAGVGKSRLLAEAKKLSSVQDLAWLEGRALSFGRGLSYWPVQEIIRADAGIEPEDSIRERVEKVDQRIGDLFGDSDSGTSRCLAGLLGLPVWPPARDGSGYVADGVTHAEMMRAFSSFIAALASRRPLVMVFEDVHWLDESSAGLIESLLPLTLHVPLLLCLVARTDSGSATGRLLDQARQFPCPREEILLQHLPPESAMELVRSLLGPADVPPSLERLIQTKAEGNPFFVEEIVRHLIDCDGLQPDGDGGWRLSPLVPEVAIPDTLEGLLAARIDRLSPESKECLRRAAVIGRTFPLAILREVSDTKAVDVERALARLQDLQLILRTGGEPESQYAFKHVLVQEVAYEGLLVRRRRQLHLGVAGALEKLQAEHREDVYGLLAFHYTKAEDWSRAQDLLLKAGERSAAMAADAEATEHYQHAMLALLNAFDSSVSLPELDDPVAWFAERTEPFWEARRLGDLLEPVRLLHAKVLDACGPEDPRTSTAACILSGSLVDENLYDEAGEVLATTIAACGHGRADERSLSRALFLLGIVRVHADLFSEAETLFRRALELQLQDSNPDERLVQQLYVYLSATYPFMGRLDETARVIHEALSSPSIQGTSSECLLLVNLSSVCLLAGRWQSAEEHARECLSKARSPFYRGQAWRHLGAVRHAQRAFSEAETCFSEARRAFESIGQDREVARTLSELAEAQLQVGRLELAQRTARDCLALFAKIHGEGHSETAAALWTLAGAAMARGELDQADKLLAESEAIGKTKLDRYDPFLFQLLFRRGLLRHAQGRIDEASQDYESALSIGRRLEGHAGPRARQMQDAWTALSKPWSTSLGEPPS